MDFSTYKSQLAYDEVRQRGVAGVPGKIQDRATGEPVQAYSMDGEPITLVTNPSGYVPDFKVEGIVPQIEVTFGKVTMGMLSFEAILALSAAIDTALAAVQASALSAWEAANLVGAPADTAITTAIQTVGSQTRVALDALYATLATAVKAGLMPAADKAKLDAADFNATPNTIPLRNGSGNTRMNEMWLDKAPSAVDSAVRRSYIDDIVTILNAGIAGKAPTSHTHVQLERGAHLVNLSATGYIDHRVGGVAIWTVTPAGELMRGTVPWARLPLATNLAAGADLNTFTTRDELHASNAVAAAGANFPTTYGGYFKVRNSGTGYIYQSYQVYATASTSTKGRIYRRAYYNGTWTAWETPLIGAGITRGRIGITPSAANTPTAMNVTYPVGMFTSAPTTVATAYTTVPGTTVTGVSVDSETASGCTIWVTRINTSGTGVNYITVGV